MNLGTDCRGSISLRKADELAQERQKAAPMLQSSEPDGIKLLAF